MARYGLIWLEIAYADYTSLPEHTREQISARIEELLENPRQPRDGYDELTDQWTTTYGGGAGLIVLWVPRTLSRPLISAFAACRPKHHLPGLAQHDRSVWPSDLSV